MMTDLDCYVDTWSHHIRVLSEDIGPRGATTSGERLAAEYCRIVLDRLGFASRMEPFVSARSIYLPHILAAACILAAFLIYPGYGRASAVVGFLLSALALVSLLLELSFRDNPLRRLLPKAPSQNVVAVVAPANQHCQDLVLIGHIDSHRTPLVFSTARWLAAYKAYTTATCVAFAGQTILYGLGAISGLAWIWPATIVSALCAAGLIVICLQAESTPFNSGAIDNASAAGMILTLAQHLRADPLIHTRVWLTCTGCEEVQHYGAANFFRRHRTSMRNPQALVFEMLGGAGPAWLLREGIVIPYHADARLAGCAEATAACHPYCGAYPVALMHGASEMADALHAHVPAITLAGVSPEGAAPYCHQAGDTYDKIDPTVLERTYQFAWAMIRALDQDLRGSAMAE
jgi:hypothetical protein